ncbi:MAG: hypothetical protein CK538_07675 [Opitutia bacterium]|nr:MAG: hypothetical protein CK538_07675 [Opitutae bacterium]
MKSPKSYLVAILACTTVGGAAYAWKQYQELIALRAAALSGDERADLQKRLWASEKRAKDLADQLAAKRDSAGSEEAIAEVEDGAAGGERGPRGDRRTRGPGGPGGLTNALSTLQKPEIQRALALQQKGQLDARYASLFKNLNLSPAQLDKFKNLLVERQTSAMDVFTAAREQGIDPRRDPDGFRSLLASTQADIDASIKASVGEEGFKQYKSFEQTMPQRATADQLSQRLSYTATPLTAAQSASMVQILGQTAPQRAAATPGQTSTRPVGVTESAGSGRGGPTMMIGGGLPGGFGGGGNPGTPITDAAVNLAQGVLSGPQVDALKQLQQEQAAQQKISQTFRETMGGNTGGGGGTPPANAGGKKKGG